MPNMQMTLYYDEIYSSGLDRTARFPVDRYAKIAEKIREEDREALIELKVPRLAKREEILLVHDEDFVDRFLAQELREEEVRRIGLRPWKSAIVERTLRLVGGAIDGLDLLQKGVPIAGNMAGGTHHAFRGEGLDIVYSMIWRSVLKLLYKGGKPSVCLCWIWMYIRETEPRRFFMEMIVSSPYQFMDRTIFHSVKNPVISISGWPKELAMRSFYPRLIRRSNK